MVIKGLPSDARLIVPKVNMWLYHSRRTQKYYLIVRRGGVDKVIWNGKQAPPCCKPS